jgi:ribosomal protein S19E (S16A)
MSKNYTNIEVKHTIGGGKTVRKVYINNVKGIKSLTKYYKGKKIGTAKKPIHKSHVDMILIGKFIPGLFSDCKCNKTLKSRKL